MFEAIERGEVEAVPVEPEPTPAAGDYGDYDVGGDYGDYGAKPRAKHRASAEKSTRRRAKAREEEADWSDPPDPPDPRLGESTATSSEGDTADGTGRPTRGASQVVTSGRRDPETRVEPFTFHDSGFDDVPGADGMRMYVDGGREYFNDLYDKGADWVSAEYETAANTTQLWVDEYEESGRSKKRLKVDVFLDAADPYSLELMLGPIQNLLRMDLGPLAWTFHAHSNVGQNRGRRANCGGEIAGSAASVSCVANAAVQCSQNTFQNMTSGLGRFEKRAEEIAARRAQVTRAKAALGATVSFRREREKRAEAGVGLVRAPPMKRVRSRGVLSFSDDYGARDPAASAEDYVKQDSFVDLFEPDDAAAPGRDADVSSYDVPTVPSLLDGSSGGAATSADATNRFDDTAAPLNVFLTCFSTKLLEMESASGLSAFGDSNRERTVLSISATCCETALGASSVPGTDHHEGLLATCREQASCLSSDRGFEALSAASDALEALTPKHKWLPWVLVERKPVCVHACNLQQGIRRAVCNNREGTLPSDCPRFPWSKIWYDEPGVSFAGVAGVGFGLMLVVFSMAMLAQQAGCCARRKRRDDEARGETDETSPLLGRGDEK